MGLPRLLLALSVAITVAIACGPDTTQTYELRVENRTAGPLVIVPTNDDLHEVGPGDPSYLVAVGGAWWVRGGVVYDRRAAVFVFDSECALRGRLTIPSNSPAAYSLVIDADWTTALLRVVDETATHPPLAPDSSVACVLPSPVVTST